MPSLHAPITTYQRRNLSPKYHFHNSVIKKDFPWIITLVFCIVLDWFFFNETITCKNFQKNPCISFSLPNSSCWQKCIITFGRGSVFTLAFAQLLELSAAVAGKMRVSNQKLGSVFQISHYISQSLALSGMFHLKTLKFSCLLKQGHSVSPDSISVLWLFTQRPK